MGHMLLAALILGTFLLVVLARRSVVTGGRSFSSDFAARELVSGAFHELRGVSDDKLRELLISGNPSLRNLARHEAQRRNLPPGPVPGGIVRPVLQASAQRPARSAAVLHGAPHDPRPRGNPPR